MRGPRVGACKEHEAVLSTLHSLLQFFMPTVVMDGLQLLSILLSVDFCVIDSTVKYVSVRHALPGVRHEISAREDVLKLKYPV